MLEVALDPEMERALTDVAARTGATPADLARRALVAYLEDLEDYATAVEAWKDYVPGSGLTSEEMLRALDVAD